MEKSYFTHLATLKTDLIECHACSCTQIQRMDQGKSGRLFMCLSCGLITHLNRQTSAVKVLRPAHEARFMRVRAEVIKAQAIIDEAIETYSPKLCFGMLSGGHDSLVMSHVLASHPRFKQRGSRFAGIVHINTGIGIEETRSFVRNVCHYYQWTLLEYKASEHTKPDGEPDPQLYEQLVKAHGFPGPAHHRKMYNRLKGRQVQRLIREQKALHKLGRRDKIMLASGIRQQESQRRMGYDDPVDVDGSKLWVNPCFFWSKQMCIDYMQTHFLPENEVVKKLCMSGECLCGAFAKPGELAILQAEYPEAAKTIMALEPQVSEAGFPWKWDEKPPGWWNSHRQGQGFLPGLKPDSLKEGAHLCTSCAFNAGENHGH